MLSTFPCLFVSDTVAPVAGFSAFAATRFSFIRNFLSNFLLAITWGVNDTSLELLQLKWASLGSDADAIATPEGTTASAAASAATWERLRRFFACFGSAAASIARSIRFFFNFCRFLRSRSFAASILARFSTDTDGAAAVAATLSFPANAIAFFFSRLSRRTRLRLEMPKNPAFLLRVPLDFIGEAIYSDWSRLTNGFDDPDGAETGERGTGGAATAWGKPEAERFLGGRRSCLPIIGPGFKLIGCGRYSALAAARRLL